MSFAHLRSCVREDQKILRRLVREEIRLRLKLEDLEEEKSETKERIDSTRIQLQKLCEEAFFSIDVNSSGRISVWEFVKWFFAESDLAEEELQTQYSRAMDLFQQIDTNDDDLLSLKEVISFHEGLLERL